MLEEIQTLIVNFIEHKYSYENVVLINHVLTPTTFKATITHKDNNVHQHIYVSIWEAIAFVNQKNNISETKA